MDDDIEAVKSPINNFSPGSGISIDEQLPNYQLLRQLDLSKYRGLLRSVPLFDFETSWNLNRSPFRPIEMATKYHCGITVPLPTIELIGTCSSK